MKTLPHSPESEQAVLGAILREGTKLFHEVSTVLTARDFFSAVHSTVYRAMATVAKSGGEIDPVTVGNVLQSRKQMIQIGGAETLSKLLDGFVASVSVLTHAHTVAAQSAVRSAAVAAYGIYEAGMSNPEDADEYLSESARIMGAALKHRVKNSDFLNADEGLSEILKEITEERQTSDIIPSGFAGIDLAYGGIVSPLLYILGGRPSMGKSTFLLNLAVQVCQAGRRVLFITLEDSRRMQQQRLLSRFSGVPVIDIMRRRLCTNDQRAVFEATRYLQGMPLTFCDRRGLHSDDIRRIALSYQAEYGCDLVMVDHLGYIRGMPKEYERNSANIRAMADLAGELGTPLILAFQLNRELTRRDDKRPRLSDLRGTGTAEEDASAVWFVHRPHVFDPNESPNMFELIIAKCKWGPLATVELKCDLNCFRVGNIENEGY